LAASVLVANEAVVNPVATCGGGFEVPNATLKVVPGAPGAHDSTGAVLTPMAPLAGFGFDGAGGGPTAPAVVKVQVADVAIIDELSGVALVRETTFQKYVVPGCSDEGVNE
jgi:hypothetical protein